MFWFLTRALPFLAIVATVIWAVNTSLWIEPVAGKPRIIAHRGVQQTYAGETLDSRTCTANPVAPADHELIGNTLPAMEAAFEAGADVVAIDIQLTADGVFAVFEDWTLDCRTQGRGVARMMNWALLHRLDIGYGYTPDGKTYPLRGKGVGLMPRLEEVLDAFPEGRFLVNLKSNDARVGTAFAEVISGRISGQDQIWAVHGGQSTVEAAMAALPGLRGFHSRGVTDCVRSYTMSGWSGQIPETCRNTVLPIEIGNASWLWGWPRLFQKRMNDAGTELILLDEWSGEGHSTAIDDAEMLSDVPAEFSGYIWTDRILDIAPLVRKAD